MPLRLALAAATILALAPTSRLAAQEAATAAEAAAAIDLAAFPIPPGAVAETPRRLAGLAYEVPGGPRSGYAGLAKTLAGLGWKELPGGYLDDQACSGSFGKGGFTLSASAIPAQEGSGKVTVRLNNLGNVDLARLPVPPGVKVLYSFPATTAYAIDRPAAEVGGALRTLLVAGGWAPYGRAGDALFFRKNAVRLTARPVADPAQDRRTIIQFSAELMSAELPAPTDALDVAYADSTKALSLDVAMAPAALASFYKDSLGRSGWKATTEAPVKDDFRDLLVFRGPARELITIRMHPVDGKLRATVEHRTAAEFEEEMRRAEAAAARREAGPGVSAAKAARVAVPIPAGARGVARRKDAVEFKLAAGQALPAARAIRDAAVRGGWKEGGKPQALDPTAGAIALEKEAGASLVIVYIDAGFGDAEVKVNASNAEIVEPAKP